jgi:hypothetical protein
LPSLLVLVCLGASSCATYPYRPLGDSALSRAVRTTPPGEAQFEYGRTNAFLDTVGWVVGVPSKLILLDSRMDNHHVGDDTVGALRAHLERNGLSDVKVRVNQYAPQREFRRLVRNKSVGWGWRYTIGLVSWLYQAVLPGRILGGDNYNPYTDTINLYSDVRAVAVHEGGHAKDLAARRFKGAYAFAYSLPVLTLYAEARASNDAVSHQYAYGSVEEEKEAYRILYPAMGTYIGGTFGGNLLSPWYLAGVVPGHVIGRVKAARVNDGAVRRPRMGSVPPAADPPEQR